MARRLKTPVWVYDIDEGRIILANSAACQLWQAESEHALTLRDLTSDMSTTVATRLRQYQNDFRDRDATFSETWTLYPNGQPTSVKVVFSGFPMRGGRMAMQCEAVGALGEAGSETLRSVAALLHTDVMITLYASDGLPVYMNPAARNATSNSDLPFRSLFVNADDHDALLFELDRAGEHRIVAMIKTVAGNCWFDVSATHCLDAATGKPAVLVTATDVSELKNARDTARFLADRDQLTGCYNRLFLQSHMAGLEHRSDAPAALIYFDIDHFKHINDQFGHEMGDRVLCELAERARGELRKSDTLTRLGGDEFVILLENVTDAIVETQKIDRLQKVLSQEFRRDLHQLGVSVSMGVSLFWPSETGFETALHEADIALYKSKSDGRNCWTLYDEVLGAAAAERRLVEREIQTAIEDKQFVLYYQPRVEVATGRIVSVEALVRWDHPERGLIQPNSFIGLCEETGMILDLGHEILTMGCEQCLAWHRGGLDVDVSINISPRQFDDPRLMQTLEEYSQRLGFPKGRVELEITEGVLIGDHSRIERKLDRITKMGFGIAIDDFGTGYSNLSYISRFPLQCIKIDRSFVRQLPESGPIIGLIQTLAREIGAYSVAEGVETEEQNRWLSQHGCTQIQGFYYYPPLPVAEFEALMPRSTG